MPKKVESIKIKINPIVIQPEAQNDQIEQLKFRVEEIEVQYPRKSRAWGVLAGVLPAVSALVIALVLVPYNDWQREKMRAPVLDTKYCSKELEKPFRVDLIERVNVFFEPRRENLVASPLVHQFRIVNTNELSSSVSVKVKIRLSTPAAIHAVACKECGEDFAPHVGRNFTEILVTFAQIGYNQERTIVLGIAYPPNERGILSRERTFRASVEPVNGGYITVEDSLRSKNECA